MEGLIQNIYFIQKMDINRFSIVYSFLMMMAYETVFHVLVEEEGEGRLGFSLAAFLVVVEAEYHESEIIYQ